MKKYIFADMDTNELKQVFGNSAFFEMGGARPQGVLSERLVAQKFLHTDRVKFAEEAQWIVDDLYQTVKHTTQHSLPLTGLAATQIGSDKEVCVVVYNRRGEESNKQLEILPIINPFIDFSRAQGLQVYPLVCASSDYMADAKFPLTLPVEFTTLASERVKVVFEGPMAAIVMQHIQASQGITLGDHVGKDGYSKIRLAPLGQRITDESAQTAFITAFTRQELLSKSPEEAKITERALVGFDFGFSEHSHWTMNVEKIMTVYGTSVVENAATRLRNFDLTGTPEDTRVLSAADCPGVTLHKALLHWRGFKYSTMGNSSLKNAFATEAVQVENVGNINSLLHYISEIAKVAKQDIRNNLPAEERAEAYEALNKDYAKTQHDVYSIMASRKR